MIVGSSPLTRGKPSRPEPSPQSRRLIPAHAGKTASAAWAAVIGWAHPRSRGENLNPARFGKVLAGSSPLTRGKQAPGSPQAKRCGLIPAHAGKTMVCPSVRVTSRAHPRSRGENHGVQSRVVNQTGSSPLTRGKQEANGGLEIDGRLIPAHAGKTSAPRVAAARSWAHPRSRGENPTLLITTPHVQGSSPLTRGKRTRTNVENVLERLIPAHAGKTR